MSDLILYDSTRTFSVNFTKQGLSVTRSGTNPLIIIPIPTGKDAAELGGAFSIDLKMMTQRIDLKFTLIDGVGSHYVGATPASMVGKTDYEKLWYMFAYDQNDGADSKKQLDWEGHTFYVVIDSLNTPTDEGNYKMMQNCSLSMVVVNP